MNCNQRGCDEPAAYVFTWPGKDQEGICRKHVRKLREVADAFGLYVQIIEIGVFA